MGYDIDYYKSDIDALFANLENKDIKNYILYIYNFDERGAELYTKLSKNEKYYPFHSEMETAEATAKSLSKKVGSDALFFEYGCGNCVKSYPFLKHLNLKGFVALDIDRNVIEKAKIDIKNEFPDVDMHIVADDMFTANFNLPKRFEDHKMKIFYMSCKLITLFKRDHLPIFFEHMSKLMKKGDLCIISIDPMKDMNRIYDMYKNDHQEKLVKNILHRLNKDYNANFDEDNFEYSCIISIEDECKYYNLMSKKDHEVKINDRTYKVLKGKLFGMKLNNYNYNTVKENGLKVGLKIFDSWTSSDGLMMNIGLEKEI